MMQGGAASMWQVESQTITQGGAVAFLLIASGSLLLLYFFLDKAFFVILVSWHIYPAWHMSMLHSNYGYQQALLC